MTRLPLIVVLLACDAGTSVAPPALPQWPHWIDQTWSGPYDIGISLCPDGRYSIAGAIETPGGGWSCCTDVELGRYELVRRPDGAIAAVAFTPTRGISHVDPISDGRLDGFEPSSRSRCW